MKIRKRRGLILKIKRRNKPMVYSRQLDWGGVESVKGRQFKATEFGKHFNKHLVYTSAAFAEI